MAQLPTRGDADAACRPIELVQFRCIVRQVSMAIKEINFICGIM